MQSGDAHNHNTITNKHGTGDKVLWPLSESPTVAWCALPHGMFLPRLEPCPLHDEVGHAPAVLHARRPLPPLRPPSTRPNNFTTVITFQQSTHHNCLVTLHKPLPTALFLHCTTKWLVRSASRHAQPLYCHLALRHHRHRLLCTLIAHLHAPYMCSVAVASVASRGGLQSSAMSLLLWHPASQRNNHPP